MLAGNAFAVVVADPGLVLDGAAFAACDYDFGVGPDDCKLGPNDVTFATMINSI